MLLSAGLMKISLQTIAYLFLLLATCASATDVPVFGQVSYTWFLHDTFIGGDVAAVKVSSASSSPISVSIVSTSANQAFYFAAGGILRTAPVFSMAALAFPIAGNLTAEVNGSCTAAGGSSITVCRASVPFTIEKVVYHQRCPSQIVRAAFQPVPVSLTPPSVTFINGTNSRLLLNGNQTVYGTDTSTIVRYSLVNPDLSQLSTSLLLCNTTVVVRYGAEFNITRSSHTYHYESSNRSAVVRDFIIDTSGFLDTLQAPPIVADVLGHGLTLLLLAPQTSPFTVYLPLKQKFLFATQIQYCSSGPFPSDLSTLVSLKSSATLYNVNDTSAAIDPHAVNASTAVSLSFESQSSVITTDGRCFQISFRSKPLTSSIAFQALLVSIAAPTDVLASPRFYEPLPSGALLVDVAPLSSNAALQRDPGPVFALREISAPIFTFCPSNVSVVAAQNALGAPVLWDEPEVMDFTGISYVTQTAYSGDMFTIAGSPHVVKYVAYDLAGLSSACVFSVNVTYDTQPFDVYFKLDLSNNIVHSTDFLGRNMYTDLCFEYNPADPLNFTVDISRHRSLALFGYSNSPLQFRPVALDAAIYFSYDLRFSVMGLEASMLPSIDVFSSFQFYDSTPIYSYNSYTPFSAFDSVGSPLSTVEPGRYIRLAGRSTMIASGSGFSFSEFVLSLNFPVGFNASTGDVTYVLEEGSFVGFSYVYNDVAGYVVDEPSSRYGYLQYYDTTPPSFGTTCPSTLNMTIETAFNASRATATWPTPKAADNIGVTYFYESIPSNASLLNTTSEFAIGSTSVVYEAEDLSGYYATCEFVVEVVDHQPPFVICPGPQIFVVGSESSTFHVPDSVYQAVGLWDNSGSTPALFSNSTAPLEIGNHTVHVTAYDNSGNEASCDIDVAVLDRTPPVFTLCPASVQFSTPGLSFNVTWNPPTAKDNSLQLVNFRSNYASGSLFAIGTTNVEIFASDSSGNQALCVFQVQITSTASSASSLSSGTITGIGVGVGLGVLVLIILIVVIVALARQKRQQRLGPYNFNGLLTELSAINTGSGPREPRELKREKIKVVGVLGKGNFGEVCKGLLTEVPNSPGFLVAIKTLHASLGGEKGSLLEEAAVMAQFEHANIVGLHGVVTVGDPLMVVMEYCEHGALNSYLEKNDLSNLTKLFIASDCAQGLAYLANRNFVHRDIAARNVLVSSERRAKIADFGLSREANDDNYYQSRGGQLPVRWTAPEALEKKKFSCKSDCWSYGVLLYEIWSKAETPYQGMNNQQVWIAVTSGFRLPCPPGCNPQIHKMMVQCWHVDPHERPSFEELFDGLNILTALADDVPVHYESRPLVLEEYADFKVSSLRPDEVPPLFDPAIHGVDAQDDRKSKTPSRLKNFLKSLRGSRRAEQPISPKQSRDPSRHGADDKPLPVQHSYERLASLPPSHAVPVYQISVDANHASDSLPSIEFARAVTSPAQTGPQLPQPTTELTRNQTDVASSKGKRSRGSASDIVAQATPSMSSPNPYDETSPSSKSATKLNPGFEPKEVRVYEEPIARHVTPNHYQEPAFNPVVAEQQYEEPVPLRASKAHPFQCVNIEDTQQDPVILKQTTF